MQQSLLTIAQDFAKRQKPDCYNDQFFLVDDVYIKKLADAAKVNKEDRVLEVGPGLGFLTLELAKRCKEVLAIEIDTRFKPYLGNLPKNVEIVFGDAYRLLNNKGFLKHTKRPTKTVSAIPYSRAQNMLHNYTNWPWYQGDLFWIAAASLADKVNRERILSAYFLAEVLELVPKSAFYPEPNTSSAIIHFKRIPDPMKTGNFQIYLRRWFYDHENQKVKNTLREGLINAAKDLKGTNITKNQARILIDQLNLPQEHLDVLTNNIRPEYYFELPERLKTWFDQL